MKQYKYKLGFVGAGNMARAISSGLIGQGLMSESDIIMGDINKDIKVGGITVTDDISHVLGECEYIILSIKPQVFNGISASLASVKAKAVISIMAGICSQDIKRVLPDGVAAIRVMPNTPCAIGKGMVVIADNDAGDEINGFVKSIFDTTGDTLFLPEQAFDAVTSVSGSGPAYVYYFIRSMIKGGIDGGLSEESSKALTLATVIGAAEMVKHSSESLDVLIDRVCSKGGTTIQAVNCYDECNLDGIIREGMKRCFNRSAELSGNN
ncbi:MAG: pyrroline-5-carboxylate reductase [Clostridia bacterium]|nr:pyrroline-5-carboxylate reductase [Clostridia bacterium]